MFLQFLYKVIDKLIPSHQQGTGRTHANEITLKMRGVKLEQCRGDNPPYAWLIPDDSQKSITRVKQTPASTFGNAPYDCAPLSPLHVIYFGLNSKTTNEHLVSIYEKNTIMGPVIIYKYDMEGNITDVSESYANLTTMLANEDLLKWNKKIEHGAGR
ncbi:hypothetical protein RhiirA5_369036 [Rhizophagus irregularis]|uniref:Uncharacterized protein n=1 Tax=Rhizophagus irregularis TaxID=588596 RepID=A0A2I1DXZ9_9GLOM|nr:hypothetical protein RhiirA5_369036 [Rhizophagus irregularis]PKC65504.1 hypothetical protein RhiirA1_460953 [Rhizophagus irregularis]PKY14752.1 hypothetical protein RhiirB3_426827 [Rhizophagus irregularis]CAB4481487.1 unnamed protein product [Rhizophagus irregularis]CAB5383422.1 unnamed protein product [Rhizophagus irregularis]